MYLVRELSKCFQENHPLFKAVSFSLQRGGRLQITGSNGIGKTTLMKCLAGFLDFDCQSIRFEEREMTVRDVAFASTDERSFFPKLTLKENILFFKNFYGQPLYLESLIETLGLDEHWQKTYQSCSTGIRKRLAIYRSILKGTPILLLDEPFANMDADFSEKLSHCIFQGGLLKDKIIIFTSNSPLPEKPGLQTLSLEKGEARP